MRFSLPRSVVKLQPVLVAVVPLLVLTGIFMGLGQPRIQAASAARERLGTLQQQAVSLRARLAGSAPVDGDAPGDALPEFERRTPSDDRVPELLEQLAQRVLRGADGEKIQNLMMETGERVAPPPPLAEGTPRTAGVAADSFDPRLDLFGAPLSYTPVTIAFDSSYSRLGSFLWELHSLPTLVEVRSLEIGPAANPSLVHVSLVIIAFQRMEPPSERQSAIASAGFVLSEVEAPVRSDVRPSTGPP